MADKEAIIQIEIDGKIIFRSKFSLKGIFDEYVKTAFFNKADVIPDEDVEAYKKREQEYREEYKNLNSHRWTKDEIPRCIKCGGDPIHLGFWGDDDYRKVNLGYKIPCPVTDRKDYKHPELEERCYWGE